jgi:hypothetical protein
VDNGSNASERKCLATGLLYGRGAFLCGIFELRHRLQFVHGDFEYGVIPYHGFALVMAGIQVGNVLVAEPVAVDDVG